jgi:hypothetical protein
MGKAALFGNSSFGGKVFQNQEWATDALMSDNL